jgi:phage terminase large subunit-like protein
VLNYAKDIVAGKKVACKELIQSCQRFLDDLNNPLYDFKTKNAEFVIQIIEETFVHTKGDLMGKPFKLEKWEKFICYNIAGFYLKGTSERRFHEAFIFIPRKNGKTSFVSALAWSLSLLDRKTASNLYIIATKLDRALESFNIINKNIDMMGESENFKILDNNAEHSISRTFYNELGVETGSIRIQALASDANRADGLNANLIILDEIHAYRNANEYFVYKQAMKAYTNKLLLGITTAGKDMNSFCYQRLLYCQKVLEKTLVDDQYFIFICKADQDKKGNVDYTNPIEHEKANPNYEITIRSQDIMGEALQAQNDPSSRNEFLNKSLNIYTNVANAYFDINEVKDSDSEYNWTLEDLIKLPVKWTGGADLSIMYDLTAGVLYTEYEGVGITITHGFIPVTQAQKKANEDEIPFFWWEEEGWLTMCNGDVVNHQDIVKWFIQMRNMGFRINNVAFDKYKSREFVKFMEQARFKVESLDQQYWKKSEAFRDIERKIKDKKFYYLHNKAFEYCIGNVKAVEDADERVRFEKVAPKKRMDLFDATVIACKQYINDKDKKSRLSGWF